MNLSKPLVFSCAILMVVLFGSMSPSQPLNQFTVEEQAVQLYKEINNDDLSRNAFLLGYLGYSRLVNQQSLSRDSILSIIDFSKPSHIERMYVIDLKNKCVLKKSLVAHGKGSGLHYARHFSNTPYSNTSSLGFFIADKTYSGKHGYSLRLRGMETDINNNAYKRAIVVHGANYVNADFINHHGRIGRSFGCPALPYTDSQVIIDMIKEGSCLFIYSPNENYLNNSQLISSSYYYQTAS